jgi:formate dehydrogenase subunit gamma
VHAIVGVVLIAIVIAHIYIGTIGMEGAWDAMGSGEVDLDWARHHHPVWVEDEVRRARQRRARSATAPAE